MRPEGRLELAVLNNDDSLSDIRCLKFETREDFSSLKRPWRISAHMALIIFVASYSVTSFIRALFGPRK